jgi:hypothetical protein
LSRRDYLAEHFAAHEQPGLAPVFDDALAGGRAIVLLDGLDEVLDASERLVALQPAVPPDVLVAHRRGANDVAEQERT